MIALRRTRTSPIGLHLGPRWATMAQMAGPRERPHVHVLAAGELPAREGRSPDEQDAETSAALRRLVADHRFRGRQVVSCLGAQDLFLQNVRLPQLPPEEVAKVIRWEAEERLPYPLAEAEIRHIPAGKVRQDANVKQEVILMACHQGVLQRHLRVVERAGLTPLAIDVEPCAVLRGLRRPAAHESTERRACLHFGENAVSVIFAEGEQILFLKYIPGGGEQLDQAVARQMDLGAAEAARMRAAVTSAQSLDATNDLHRSVIDAIRGPLEATTTEIEHCLRYYKVTFRGKPLERMTLTGSDACTWLAEFLSERLALPCEMGSAFEGLSRWPTSAAALERPWRWTTAVGLAMKR